MTAVLIGLVVVLAVGLAVLAYMHLSYRVNRPSKVPVTGTRRILFPFVSHALSARALDAALRLARAEDATLVPVFLCRVSLDLPLDVSLPRQSGVAIPLQEAIEQRAAAFGIPVDARIERGRSYRHALRQALANEHFDRIVLAAAPEGGAGFHADDVAWLLENAPGEIVVLRPDTDERIGAPGSRGAGARRWIRSPRPRTMRARSRPPATGAEQRR